MTGTSARNHCGIFKSKKVYNLALQYGLELNSKKACRNLKVNLK